MAACHNLSEKGGKMQGAATDVIYFLRIPAFTAGKGIQCYVT
jgi:hypothetical protein